MQQYDSSTSEAGHSTGTDHSSTEQGEASEDGELPAKRLKRACAWDIIGVSVDESSTGAQASAKTEAEELHRYLAADSLPRTADPLVWCEQAENIYPCLAQVAAKVLCVPSTATPVEQTLFACGLVVSQHRASLKAEDVDAIVLF